MPEKGQKLNMQAFPVVHDMSLRLYWPQRATLMRVGHHIGITPMRRIVKLTAIICLLIAPALGFARAGEGKNAAPSEVGQTERGKYVIVITGCNDCHTPGYAESGGKVPVERWLTGDRLGYRGPWGTTYPNNLRLYFQELSEDEWVDRAKGLRTRPS